LTSFLCVSEVFSQGTWPQQHVVVPSNKFEYNAIMLTLLSHVTLTFDLLDPKFSYEDA